MRAFLAKESPPEYVRAMLEDEVGISDHVWNQLVELGWTGLLVPEAQGGLGLGLVDLIVVLEEMGQVPFPGPFLSSAVFATLAARRLGLDDQLRSLAAGATRGTIAVDELGHGDPVDRLRTRAKRKGGQWRLYGLKPVVLDGATADWALVPARTQEGIGRTIMAMTAISARHMAIRMLRLRVGSSTGGSCSTPGAVGETLTRVLSGGDGW